MRKRWIVDQEGHDDGRHPATFGIIRCWTFRGAQRLASRWSRRFNRTYDVYGPTGKGG
jgi:hypothetical protein